MCIQIKASIKPKIAKRDMIVYKILKINRDGEYLSSIEKFKYEKNVLYETEILESQNWSFADDNDKGYFIKKHNLGGYGIDLIGEMKRIGYKNYGEGFHFV